MRVIVIGASAGGVSALKALVSELPPDLGAPILIVVHVAPSGPSLLPEILSRAGPLPCVSPNTGEHLQAGHIYIAPPDFHMLIDAQRRIRLSRGPKENRTRPAIDPLFRSAALAFGAEVIGVVLTGHLDDGTAGLFVIKESGGIAVVQDSADAEAPSMPANAAQRVPVDYRVTLRQLAPLLVRLTKEPISREQRIMPEQLNVEAKIMENPEEFSRGVTQIGDPTVLTCPECHGTLLQLRDQRLVRFRCHTGHGFSALSLLEGLDVETEEAIWNAVRVLQESAMLREHLAQHARDAGREDEAGALLANAQERLQRAKRLRAVATNDTPQQRDADQRS
jgi:two-component system, chemotaxis family, protein-glutamate methylesterase/glutaminase